MNIVLDNKSQISISNKIKKKKIKGYHQSKNRIDLDSYCNHPKVDIKYNNVTFPMYVSGIEIGEFTSSRKIRVNYNINKLKLIG